MEYKASVWNQPQFCKFLFKINHILVKNITFTIFLIKIKIFCNKNNIGLKYFADIRLGMFLVQIDRQN